MKKIQVYDLPTRLFHWLFTLLFVGAFFIGKTIDDDSPVFAYHMLMGLTLAIAVVLRIVWGFIGSPYARFSSFRLGISELLAYGTEVVTGKPRRELGHNPASSWAALVMMVLALALAVTGVLMTAAGLKESLEDFHEILSTAFVIVVIAHIGGVVLHSLRHRDAIGLSMVHGKKDEIHGQIGISRSYRGAGVMFVVLLGLFAIHLNRNYDPASQELSLLGATLSLGESEEHQHGVGDGEASEAEDRGDDHEDEDGREDWGAREDKHGREDKGDREDKHSRGDEGDREK